MREIIINNSEQNQRFDKFLLKYMNKSTKSFIYKMLRKKNIKLNDTKAEGNEILKSGDKITLYLSEETIEKFMEEKSVNYTADKVNIIWEDENIIICNKPIGVLSHPESSSDNNTLIDRILFYLQQKNEFNISKDSTFTPAICNRLDRNTSGIVVCGKNLASVQWLNKVFLERKVDKFYRAIVKGEITKSGELVGYYKKNYNTNEAIIINKNEGGAKEIITQYNPIKYSKDYTLLEIKLITGKSHQIRAHLSHIGHAIVGDTKYGDPEINKLLRKNLGISSQLLHAEKIVFEEENGFLGYLKGNEFIATLPKDFYKAENFLFN